MVAPMRKGVERTTASFPFLTTYDPPGTSEGSLDPLGLYRIADQLAVQLVPAVRERMQRIRFGRIPDFPEQCVGKDGL